MLVTNFTRKNSTVDWRIGVLITNEEYSILSCDKNDTHTSIRAWLNWVGSRHWLESSNTSQQTSTRIQMHCNFITFSPSSYWLVYKILIPLTYTNEFTGHFIPNFIHYILHTIEVHFWIKQQHIVSLDAIITNKNSWVIYPFQRIYCNIWCIQKVFNGSLSFENLKYLYLRKRKPMIYWSFGTLNQVTQDRKYF